MHMHTVFGDQFLAHMQIVTFNYGKGTENPINQVWFYRKPEPTEAVKVYQHQVF